MGEIKTDTEEKDRYTIKMTYLPDNHIQSITIWKSEMGSAELGDLIKELDQEYQPLKIIIISI